MKKWEETFAQAGRALPAAAARLAQEGIHLTIARADPQRASVRLEILSIGSGIFAQLERTLGLSGLAHRAAAVPLDRVAALAAAIRARRADFYDDPVVFVGDWLLARPTLAALVRQATRLLALPGA